MYYSDGAGRLYIHREPKTTEDSCIIGIYYYVRVNSVTKSEKRAEIYVIGQGSENGPDWKGGRG